MPDLPTITVTQSQAKRILAAFTGHRRDDGSSMEPREAYVNWLRNNLIGWTTRQEQRAAQEAMESDMETSTMSL